MKEKMRKAGRVLVAAVVLVSCVFGYVYYERTLVVWWYPVAVSVAVALLTFPLLSRHWRWMTDSVGPLRWLCHLYIVGGLCYFLLLTVNYAGADASSTYEEEIEVLEKKRTVRKPVRNTSRRFRTTGRTVCRYYLHVRFSDGTCKKVPVTLAVYNRSGKGSRRTFFLQKGLLGFRVIKSMETTSMRKKGV